VNGTCYCPAIAATALTQGAQQTPGLFVRAVYLAAFVPDLCAALAPPTVSDHPP